jgi:succinate dehydrogenase flavin-adding protein (antitoxin of CptAB toxin-antitoxin module)
MRNVGNKLFHEDFSRFRDKTINSLDNEELNYWSNILNCDTSILIQAIVKVGTNVMLINDWLILNRMRNEFLYS